MDAVSQLTGNSVSQGAGTEQRNAELTAFQTHVLNHQHPDLELV